MSTETTDDYGLAWRGGWRRKGLIHVPTGVTAEGRFGDVIAGDLVKQGRRKAALARWQAACEQVADERGRCDVFELAGALEDGWWK